MDAARTAKRLGASEAIVVYRRTKDRMPAHESELAEAEDEGVLFKWLTTIKQVESGKLVVERMELDDTGFPQPTGEVDELDADSLILALGQETDLSLLDDVPGLVVEDGVVAVGPDLMTGCPGVFAGGDMVPYERSVTVAVGHGKRAARHIDAWLSGAVPEPAARPSLATFDTLNTWYYSDAPRAHRRCAGARPARVHVRRGGARPRRIHRPARGPSVHVVRQLLRLRQLLRRLPRQRRHQAGPPRRGLPDRPRLLQGLRALRLRVPIGCDPDVP